MCDAHTHTNHIANAVTLEELTLLEAALSPRESLLIPHRAASHRRRHRGRPPRDPESSLKNYW